MKIRGNQAGTFDGQNGYTVQEFLATIKEKKSYS